MADNKEIKPGGHKNGRKGGPSGSSFFTWFIVIALLGVWTSVAVIWFDLIDYEEVLGKLGVYDADGDGDFDVEDAKILLAEGPSGKTKRNTKAKVKELIKEEIKKEKEKLESRKESKAEERKKEKNEKDDRKDKKLPDSNVSSKGSTKGKKDREKSKIDPDKSDKSKESRKKLTNIKDIPSRTGPRDKDNLKEGRSSSKHTHLAKGSNQNRKS